MVIDQKSECLSNLIFNGNTSTCRILVTSSLDQCSIHRFLSGVLFKSCPMTTIFTNFRGISKTLAKPDQSLFFKNTDFQQLVVGSEIVTSKGDFIHEIIKSGITPSTFDHNDIKHLIIPGVEHDLESLENLNKAMRATAEGFLREYTSKYTHIMTLLFTIVLLLIIIGGCSYCIYRVITTEKRHGRQLAEELVDLRRRRAALSI